MKNRRAMVFRGVAISWEEQPHENAGWSAQLRWDALPALASPAGIPRHEIAGDSRADMLAKSKDLIDRLSDLTGTTK